MARSGSCCNFRMIRLRPCDEVNALLDAHTRHVERRIAELKTHCADSLKPSAASCAGGVCIGDCSALWSRFATRDWGPIRRIDRLRLARLKTIQPLEGQAKTLSLAALVYLQRHRLELESFLFAGLVSWLFDRGHPVCAAVFCALTLSFATAAHAAEADVRRIWQMLDYLAVDYAGAVKNGAVVNASEFEEMREFTKTSQTKLAALEPHPERAALVAEAQTLSAAIEAKKSSCGSGSPWPSHWPTTCSRPIPVPSSPSAPPQMAAGCHPLSKPNARHATVPPATAMGTAGPQTRSAPSGLHRQGAGKGTQRVCALSGHQPRH